jgi:hypothetical protein
MSCGSAFHRGIFVMIVTIPGMMVSQIDSGTGPTVAGAAVKLE